MRFSARQDIAASPAAVFAALTDFASIERAALRRGGEVIRLDRRPDPGPGMSWQGTMPWRGRMRRFVAGIATYRPASGLSWQIEGGGLRMTLDFELIELAAGQTRMAVALEVRPETLSARLKLQAARLQRQKLADRFQARVRDFAAGVAKRA